MTVNSYLCIGLVVFLIWGCGKDPAPRADDSRYPSVSRREQKNPTSTVSSIADDAPPDFSLTFDERGPDNALSVPSLLSEPRYTRYQTPGMVRYVQTFAKPVDQISWSPHAGLSVSIGDTLYNVTTQGEKRWDMIVGYPHSVYALNGEELVWSSAFASLFQVLRHGRLGWQREWSNPPVVTPSGRFFLTDASDITAPGVDGKDLWRAVATGVRNFEHVYDCNGLTLLEGKRSQKRSAIVLSERGAIVSQFALPDNSVLLGASDKCEPMIWANNELQLMDATGRTVWRQGFERQPFIESFSGYYLLLVPGVNEKMSVLKMSTDGRVLWRSKVDMEGRIADVQFWGDPARFCLMGVCKDVSSPCARPGSNRGPFNVVLAGEGQRTAALHQMVKGNAGIAGFDGLGYAIVYSTHDNLTRVDFRDLSGAMVWDVKLPGRLTAGPFVGPYGGMYLGTCDGWNCGKKNYLIAVTVRAYE